jgi:hypothetical protein
MAPEFGDGNPLSGGGPKATIWAPRLAQINSEELLKVRDQQGEAGVESQGLQYK